MGHQRKVANVFMLSKDLLALLRNSSDLRRRQIGQALVQWTSSRSLTHEEEELVGRIEALRADLRLSNQQVTFLDLGAGSPKNVRIGSDPLLHSIERTYTVGEIARYAAKTRPSALLLFHLIRQSRPQKCIELGTSLGISAAYQGGALELNKDGRLITLEGAPVLARIAQDNFKHLDITAVSVLTGRFEDTLPETLIKLGAIDYAFIDGNHDEVATVGYFTSILPYLRPDSVLIFDDIYWSAGMTRAWRSILAHPCITTAIDLHEVGICIVKGNQDQKLLLAADRSISARAGALISTARKALRYHLANKQRVTEQE